MKICKAVLGEKLFIEVMKSSFYGHFVAGEDQYKIVPTLERLRSFGVKPILDYSVEEDLSQEEAEKREVEYVIFFIMFNLLTIVLVCCLIAHKYYVYIYLLIYCNRSSVSEITSSEAASEGM